MPIWSLIGAGLDASSQIEEWESILNTSYSWILGDSINFIVGGGRAVNIYGTDIRLVMDWEELVQQGLAKFFPNSFSTSSMLGHAGHYSGTSTNSGFNYFMGIGGATDLVFGNKSVFNYYGESVVIKRLPHAEIVVTPPKPLTTLSADEMQAMRVLADKNEGLVDKNAAQAKITAANKDLVAKMIAAGVDPLSCVTVPLPIKLCLAIGSLALLAAAVILRFYNGMDGLYSSSQVTAKGASESTELAFAIGTAVINQAETSWLYTLKMMELATQVTPGLTQAQVDELDKVIAAAKAAFKAKEAAIDQRIDMLGKLTSITLIKVTISSIKDMKDELVVLASHITEATENKTNAVNNALVSSYLAMGY